MNAMLFLDMFLSIVLYLAMIVLGNFIFYVIMGKLQKKEEVKRERLKGRYHL